MESRLMISTSSYYSCSGQWLIVVVRLLFQLRPVMIEFIIQFIIPPLHRDKLVNDSVGNLSRTSPGHCLTVGEDKL